MNTARNLKRIAAGALLAGAAAVPGLGPLRGYRTSPTCRLRSPIRLLVPGPTPTPDERAGAVGSEQLPQLSLFDVGRTRLPDPASSRLLPTPTLLGRPVR
jgi:hypothetical protein